MTVSTTTSRVIYVGNGETTSWVYSFKIATAAELVVVYTDPTGTDFILSSGQYDVTGIGSNDGGTVTYPAIASGDPPMPSGTRLTIYRDVPLTQLTSIGNQGAMWPQVIEAALDRLTWQAQQLQDQIDRTFRVGTSEQGTLQLLPAAESRANSVLGFDGEGKPYAAALDSGVVAWSAWIVANLRAATSAAAARLALGAVGTDGDDTISGTKDVTGGRLKAATRSAGDNGTDVATTAFVQAAVAAMWSTGDAKATWKNTADTGWILIDDGTISKAGAGGTTRASADCQALYVLLWNNFDNAKCAVSTGRGASGLADFNAGKAIALPRTVGRVLLAAGAGSGLTSRALGDTGGAETKTLAPGELPIGNGNSTPSTSAGNVQGIASQAATAFGLMNPFSAFNVMVKL